MEELLSRLTKIEALLNVEILNNKELLTIEEAVRLTGVSKSTIYKWIASRKLSYYKPSGKIVFIKKSDLYEFITRNKYQSKIELKGSADEFIRENSKKTFTDGSI